MKAKPIKIRRLPVAIGDVFAPGANLNYAVVVTGHDGRRAVVRNASTGRVTKIQKERLQREYARLGENDAAACYRALARLDASKAKAKAPR